MNSKNYEATAIIQNSKTENNFRKAAEGCRSPRRKRSTAIDENLLRLAVLGLVLLTLAAATACACGPDFPNNLLDRGDEAVLGAPVADFARELERLNVAPSRFVSLPATNGFDAQTLDAELADLTTALKKAEVAPEESAGIVEGHRRNREKLREYLDAYAIWDSKSWMNTDESVQDLRGSPPVFPLFTEVAGLPDEFSEYFAGVVAMRDPNAEAGAARKAWEQLLNRPTTERKYKSTWAAFMLGKSWDEEDDDEAAKYFQMTRNLAKQRFADSTGLASAAIGLEARVELRRKHSKRAIELYLEQYATGDDSAVVSLRWAAAEALAEGGHELTALAASPNTRGVIIAYLISSHARPDSPTGERPAVTLVQAWLEAVEAAGVKDMDSAERLALAAYQGGEFETAQRWVSRARTTPVAQWLQAKLLLRAGKIPQAAALLAKTLNQLPPVVESDSTNATGFVDNLHMESGQREFVSARAQMSGELGVLKLSRSEFTEALNALLRSGFWVDAAYVAERVLTTDELKAYVDREWPASAPVIKGGSVPSGRRSKLPDVAETSELIPPGETPDSTAGEDAYRHKNIRYLLARRLTRELRSGEAREYYPTEWLTSFDELVVALNGGWNESESADQRAKSLFAAAIIARTNGMALLGTELQPDWFTQGGSRGWGLTWEERATNARSAVVNVASEAEISRASQHKADPEVRFHYRYQAAFLAWEAAKLMPNNSDETARVLYTAGSWLRYRDPETADIFYKALVRRCRKTALGREADMVRWFPELDENGNVRQRLEVAQPTAASESPAGYEFIIEPGDTLFAIAKACTEQGVRVTVDEVLEANPGLQPTRLQTAKKIFIPVVVPPTIPESSE